MEDEVVWSERLPAATVEVEERRSWWRGGGPAEDREGGGEEGREEESRGMVRSEKEGRRRIGRKTVKMAGGASKPKK